MRANQTRNSIHQQPTMVLGLWYAGQDIWCIWDSEHKHECVRVAAADCWAAQELYIQKREEQGEVTGVLRVRHAGQVPV